MRTVMRTWALVAVAALATSCAAAVFAQAPAPDEPRPENVIAGELWVQFSEGVAAPGAAGKTGLAAFERAAESMGVYEIRPAFPFVEAAAAKRALPPSADGLMRVYIVRFNPSLDPMRVAAALQKNPGVVYAEPRYRIAVPEAPRGVLTPAAAPLETPNDPFLSLMPYLEGLRLPEAWDVAKGEDGDVVIAIVDAQVDWRHPELAPNIWTNPGEIPDNGRDDDGNGFVDDVRGWSFWNSSPDPGSDSDHGSHGTSMASMAGAATNNGSGMAGSSWNASIMPINASCSAASQYLCSSLSGIVYATAMGADIINASFGSANNSRTARMVYDLATDAGVLIVASAGNAGNNIDVSPHFPGSYRRALSVGSTRAGSNGVVNSYGRSVNVFAPGENILGIFNRANYAVFKGTSSSTALVSGAAALVKTRFPHFNADQVREQVRITAQSIDAANDAGLAGLLGRGRVDVLRALTETTSPAIRLVAEELVSSRSTAEGVETAIDLTFTNHLAPARDLELSLISDSPWITVTKATENVGSLGEGQSHTARFLVVHSVDAPYRTSHPLHTRATAPAYDDAPDILRLLGNPGSVATHSTGAIVVSITTEGNIGFLDHARNSRGVGFVVRRADGTASNLLFEAGLMIGTGPTSVRDAARAGPGRQDLDFVPKKGATLSIASPGALVTEEGRMELVDEGSAGSLGLEVLQETFVDATAAHEDFATFSYTVRNASGRNLDEVHVGIFADWDVNPQAAAADVAGVDPGRRLGFVAEQASNPQLLAGIMALSSDAPFHHRAADTNRDLAGRSFDDGTKWSYLSGGVRPAPGQRGDFVHVVGTGPYAIGPGEEVVVAFALVVGRSQADILANADAAQRLWDNALSPSAQSASRLQLVHNVPGVDVDVYVDGSLVLDDWAFRSATGFSLLDAGSHEVAVVAGMDTDDSSPLASLEFESAAGSRYQILVYGNADEVLLTVVENVRRAGTSADSVDLYLAHGARDLGPATVRVLDPAQENAAVAVLAGSVAYGEVASYHTLPARALTLEVAPPAGFDIPQWYSLDFGEAAGEALVLGLSGPGSDAAGGLGMIGVRPGGEVLVSTPLARATAGLQLIHNAAGLDADIYLDGKLLLDDWAFRSATLYEDVVAGPHRLEVVEASASDNSSPLAMLEVDYAEAADNQIMLVGSRDRLALLSALDVRAEEAGAGLARFYLAHGAPDAGTVAVHLLDPADSNRRLVALEDSMAFGEAGSYYAVEARPLNIEVAIPGGESVIEVFAFDFGGLAGESLVLGLSGTGARASDGLTVMGVLAGGEVLLPGVVTGTGPGQRLPEAFALRGNYPNPFNPVTRVVFDLPARASVALELIDVLGRTVRTVPAGEMAPGPRRSIELDGTGLASGIYVYRVTAVMQLRAEVQTGRMTLLR